MPPQTDLQYKDELRKELMMYKRYIDMAKSGNIESLLKEFEENVARIEASLQD